MKKLLFLIVFSIFSFQFSIAQSITFEQTIHDFGEVSHSLPAIEHTFEFKNTGNEPLVIIRTQTSCSCVKVDFTKRPIEPGQTGTLKVTYEVNKKEAGVFYKLVEVYSNSPEKRNSLIIKGIAK